jgi:hypothetical protein
MSFSLGSVSAAAKSYRSTPVQIRVQAQGKLDLNLLPSTQGWKQISNTKLLPVCKPSESAFSFSYPGGCGAVVYAWGSAAYDTKRNRLILFGGGHNDYYGNEVYALDLTQQKMLRLNQPTPLSSPPSCSTYRLPDGKPNGRHTYGGLSYASHVDKMSVLGGATSCLAGGMVADAWWLNFAKLEVTPESASVWEFVHSGYPNQGYSAGLTASDYDPINKLVYFIDSPNGIYSFDPASNKISQISSVGIPGYHYTAVIHPLARTLLAMGNGYVVTVDLIGADGFAPKRISLSGCDGLVSVVYPGLAYDSKHNRLVGWSGGANVYIIDLVTKSCQVRSVTSGTVPGPQNPQGTHGRFRYIPDLDGFVLINSESEDAYMLRLD